jgi:hypothetical protein
MLIMQHNIFYCTLLEFVVNIIQLNIFVNICYNFMTYVKSQEEM